MVSSVGRIEHDKLTRYQDQMTSDDFDRMAVAVDKISDFKLYIDDQPARSLHQIRSSCRAIKRKHGELGLVVIDYLQLMTGEGDSRHEVIASISRGLKVLAKELNVPVLALSQLNRDLEKRPNKRPMMSDLRESGQLGGRAQLKREQYLLQEEATTAFEKARDAHVKRGFQITFVRGAEPPKS